MSSRSPSLEMVIREALRAYLGRVHVALPGRIVSYDAATQKADVQPMVLNVQRSVDGDDVREALPLLTDVPVLFPRSATFFVSFPMNVGDRVLLIFNERSIDKYMTGLGEPAPATPVDITDPVDPRAHNLSDAVALPGFFPFVDALGTVHEHNMVMGKDGGAQIHFTGPLVMLGAEAPVSFVALAQKVDNELTAIKADLDALKLLLTGHTHTSATPGNQTAPSPAFAAYAPHVPVSVAATKVKAE